MGSAPSPALGPFLSSHTGKGKQKNHFCSLPLDRGQGPESRAVGGERIWFCPPGKLSRPPYPCAVSSSRRFGSRWEPCFVFFVSSRQGLAVRCYGAAVLRCAAEWCSSLGTWVRIRGFG